MNRFRVEHVAWLALMASFVIVCMLAYGFRDALLGRFFEQRFDTLLDEARDFGRRGEPDQATAVYTTLLDRYPDNEELLVAYAAFLESQGDMTNAEAALAKAASLGRQRFSAVRRYAAFLEREDRPEDAISILEDYLKRFPDDAIAHLDLGFIYMRLGRWQSAVASLQQAAQRPELEFVAHSNLAGAYSELGQVDAAIEEWRRVIAMGPGPEYQQYLQNIAVAYENLEQPESACEAWQSFLERFPNSILGAKRVLALANRCGSDETVERAALRLAALSPQHPIDASLDSSLHIAGVTEPPVAVTPGSTLALEVWFQIVRTIQKPASAAFTVEGADGEAIPIISEPGTVGTTPLWRGDTIRQPFAIQFPRELTDGTYSLRIRSPESTDAAVTLWHIEVREPHSRVAP